MRLPSFCEHVLNAAVRDTNCVTPNEASASVHVERVSGKPFLLRQGPSVNDGVKMARISACVWTTSEYIHGQAANHGRVTTHSS